MRHFQLMTVAMLAGFLVVSLPNAGEAKKKKDEEEKQMVELARTTKVSIDKAIKAVTAKIPGTVIEAELENEEGHIVWEVKVVTSKGELKEVYVDGQSGKLVDIEEHEEEKMSRHHKKGKGSHDPYNDDDEESDTEKD